MTVLRLARMCLHLLQGLLCVACLFPWLSAARRDWLVQRWSRQLVGMCGVRVRLVLPPGVRIETPAMTVANHVSWLDIFVINALQPCRFVAKSDIRDWPLVGWLCAHAGTIFIARGRVRDVRRIFEDLVHALQRGEHVAFFPEGSTAVPGTLKPFHANLFEAAIDAGVPVQPVALRYLDGAGKLHPAADFSGDIGFVESVLMICAARGMQAELTLLPAFPAAGGQRRALADRARAAIADALGYRDDGPDARPAAGPGDLPGA